MPTVVRMAIDEASSSAPEHDALDAVAGPEARRDTANGA
jgi:hypothetical protein